MAYIPPACYICGQSVVGHVYSVFSERDEHGAWQQKAHHNGNCAATHQSLVMAFAEDEKELENTSDGDDDEGDDSDVVIVDPVPPQLPPAPMYGTPPSFPPQLAPPHFAPAASYPPYPMPPPAPIAPGTVVTPYHIELDLRRNAPQEPARPPQPQRNPKRERDEAIIDGDIEALRKRQKLEMDAARGIKSDYNSVRAMTENPALVTKYKNEMRQSLKTAKQVRVRIKDNVWRLSDLYELLLACEQDPQLNRAMPYFCATGGLCWAKKNHEEVQICTTGVRIPRLVFQPADWKKMMPQHSLFTYNCVEQQPVDLYRRGSAPDAFLGLWTHSTAAPTRGQMARICYYLAKQGHTTAYYASAVRREFFVILAYQEINEFFETQAKIREKALVSLIFDYAAMIPWFP